MARISFTDVLKYMQYLPYIDGLVELIQDTEKKSGSSTNKSVDIIEGVLKMAVPLIVANNPDLALKLPATANDIYGYLDKLREVNSQSSEQPNSNP